MTVSFSWDLDTLDGSADAAVAETNRLAQYIKGKPNMEAILDALRVQAVELSDALTDLRFDRLITTAVGEQLDVLGEIVGAARESDTDEPYRLRIKAQVLVNRSSGTPEEIYAIFDLIKPALATMEIEDWFPAAFVLHLFEAELTDAEAARFGRIFRAARAGGVGGRFHWSPEAAADTFTLDGTVAQALDTGFFSGAVV